MSRVTCDDLSARESELREMMRTIEEAIHGAEDVGDIATETDLRDELRALELEFDKVQDGYATLGSYDEFTGGDNLVWDEHRCRFVRG